MFLAYKRHSYNDQTMLEFRMLKRMSKHVVHIVYIYKVQVIPSLEDTIQLRVRSSVHLSPKP